MFFQVLPVIAWLVFVYVLYAILASSLSCLPRKKQKLEKTESPFAQDSYFGNGGAGPDRICLLESPVEGLGVRLELFQSARETLDVVCHTIHTGLSTSAFFDEIRLAAERGVKVRILMDGKASIIRPAVTRMVRALAAHPNIECRYYNPFQLLKPWKWHFLMHDKFIVVDGQYLLLGGRNIGDKFFAPDSYTGKVSNDRDVLVWNRQAGPERGGSVLGQVETYFDTLWHCRDCKPFSLFRDSKANRERKIEKLHAESMQFRLQNPAYYEAPLEGFLARTWNTGKISLLHNPVAAQWKAPWIWQQMQRMAMHAREAVVLQTPYITGNSTILKAFRQISEKSDFSVLTNSAASTPNFPAFSNYYSQRRKFIATGAQIYEYQSSHSIHGKAMVVDGRLGVIGSFNMDDRSMHLDTEIMLVVDCEAFAGTLSAAIGTYQAQSLRVNSENDYIIPEGSQKAAIPVFKTPLLRVVSIFSMALQPFI